MFFHLLQWQSYKQVLLSFESFSIDYALFMGDAKMKVVVFNGFGHGFGSGYGVLPGSGFQNLWIRIRISNFSASGL